MSTYKSALHHMAMTTATDYWNDSCNTDELAYGLEHGAVGATSNPTIVHTVMKQQIDVWQPRLRELIAEMPTATEEDLAWKIAEEITLKAATMLMPLFEESGGTAGRIAIQTNPTFFRNADRIVQQGLHFHNLAPNLTIKLPVTAAGLTALEELTAHGVSTTATVSFTVPQVIAAAEAFERGLKRREKEGKSTEAISCNAVIMVGRLDDWLKVVTAKQGVTIRPDAVEWAGVAAMKRAYSIFQERGYRARLMAAAYRNHYHWSELIGGDLVVTIPYKWARRFNASDITVADRIDRPVDPEIIETLNRNFEDFRRAYEPDGMEPSEFEAFGSTARTLRTFIKSYADLLATVRDEMVPDPDR